MIRWWLVLSIGIALFTAVVEFIYRHEAHAVFGWHTVPLFDLALGLGGCLGLVFGSMWLGHRWLQRPETYYANPTPGPSREEML